MEDKERFDRARIRAISEMSGQGGIGTLAEKLLHRILKLYLEPDESLHEVKHLGSVADIKNREGITEVQTRALERLLPKLRKFLKEDKVTVVYPIVYEKRLTWLDKESGELIKPRKSPRRGGYPNALPELSKISELIGHENLTVRLVLLTVSEFKALDGWDKTKKRGATLLERIPTALNGTLDITSPSDLALLLPSSLGESFTAKEFERATTLCGRRAWFSLQLLLEKDVLSREKSGRAYIYTRNGKEE